jgi:hypothetical protein
MENGYMERFNERVRYESLNENWFSDLADAREKITQWRQDYNEKRPHGSLQCRTEVCRLRASTEIIKWGRGLKNAGPFPTPPMDFVVWPKGTTGTKTRGFIAPAPSGQWVD